MSRLPFDRNINPFIALFFVTLVGSGATVLILRAIEFTEGYAAYASTLVAQ